MGNILGWIAYTIVSFFERRKLKRKLKQLRKKDPFTYNH